MIIIIIAVIALALIVIGAAPGFAQGKRELHEDHHLEL